jgi:outer membrane protein
MLDVFFTMKSLFRLKFCSCLIIAGLLVCGRAAAQTLPELWNRVVQTEPSLMAARAQLRAVLERENQAFAQFLPQINFSANTTHNHREYQQLGLLPSSSKEFYNSNGSQISITQPIWKKTNSAAYVQSQSYSNQARLQYQASEQELLGKLVSGWAELLYAKSAWLSANALEASTREQLLNFEQGFARGLYGLGQRDEARAKFSQATADRYAAESDVFAKQISLEQLTGPLSTFIAGLGVVMTDTLPFGELQPFNVYADQISLANPSVKAARIAWEAAQQEIDKVSAQRYGSVDLVATIARNAQPRAGTTPSQSGFKSRQESIGIQLNVPLFSGGGLSAKEREAVALADKTQADLEALILSTKAQAGQAWAQTRSSFAKAAAAQQSMIAADTMLTTARVGQNAGTKTPSDELLANQQKENAKREVYRAYYDNIIGMSRLQAAIGILDVQFIVGIESRHQTPAQVNAAPDLPLRLKMTLGLPQRIK